MGMTYKGGSPEFRSLGDNVEKMKNDPQYHFKDGCFGPLHHNSQNAHDLFFDDPIAAAREFYDKIAYGGIENVIGEDNWTTKMKDGTYINFRIKTSSEGSPAVQINIKNSSDNAGVRFHKVHFSKPKK